jgi:hypothetical protein
MISGIMQLFSINNCSYCGEYTILLRFIIYISIYYIYLAYLTIHYINDTLKFFHAFSCKHICSKYTIVIGICHCPPISKEWNFWLRG